MTQSSPSPIVQFAVYEVDLRAGELRKQGLKVRLQEKPFQVLALLLERPGELVTREELQKKLWPGDTFVDFDHSMNTAVNKLREALGDSAESPRFIETLPKRGYRFIAPVHATGRAAAPQVEAPRRRPAVVGVVAALVVVLALAAYLGWQRWGRRATPPEGRIMLAVLPFENLSGDTEQEYFSDGLTEEMISQLGQIHPERLGVIARTSAMKYKKTSKGVDEIGRELAVHYLVEGSVRRGGERVRITAQLVQVSDQTEVWSESYESSAEDVLALQSEVARAIAGEIQLKLTPTPRPPRPVDPAAYEAYLKGNFHLHKLTTPGVTKGYEYFQQAIALDPNYALAYTGLAECYLLGNFMAMRPRESLPKAKAAALKALELDESLGEVHRALAAVLMDEWDWPGAEKEFKRAMEVDPGNAHVRSGYAWYLAVMGRTSGAIEQMERARELDPLSVGIATNVGRMLYFARRYDEAIVQFGKAQELDPNYIWAHFFQGIAYQQKGMHREAVAEIQKAMELGDPEFRAIGDAMGRAYARSGYPAALRAMAAGWEERHAKGYSQASSLAMIYSQLGEKEKAFEWLEVAYKERPRALIYVKVEPQFDPLRSDPRFNQFLRRMNLPTD